MHELSGTDKLNLLREDELAYSYRCKGGCLPNDSQRYRLIDLFSGAGGMTLGFSERFGQPFQSVWANDNNQYCVDTYNKNFGPHCIRGDIIEILNDSTNRIPEADVVVGGPPCQGFSLLNKKRENDPRKQLWRPFLEVVERSGADIFLMENVPQLLGSDEHREIVSIAESMGFKVRDSKLPAVDYGVPQSRVRAFILGCRFIDPAVLFPPRKTHRGPKIKNIQMSITGMSGEYLPSCDKWKTVRDAISDLPVPESTEIRDVPSPFDLHFGRTLSATIPMKGCSAWPDVVLFLRFFFSLSGRGA